MLTRGIISAWCVCSSCCCSPTYHYLHHRYCCLPIYIHQAGYGSPRCTRFYFAVSTTKKVQKKWSKQSVIPSRIDSRTLIAIIVRYQPLHLLSYNLVRKKREKYTVGITKVEPNGTTLNLKYLLSRAGDVLRNDNAGYRCQWARPSFSRVIFVNSFKSYQVPGSILATTGILL